MFFLFDLFPFVQCTPSPSMLLQMAKLNYFFLWLSCISLCLYVCLCVCVCVCVCVHNQFSLLSHVQQFATPWNAACQASLSLTNSWNLLKLMSVELVMPSNHLIPFCPILLLPSIFPSIRAFPMSQFFVSEGLSIGASGSVLPMNIQDLFPLGLTGLNSLQSKELSRVFSNTTVQKFQLFHAQLSL